MNLRYLARLTAVALALLKINREIWLTESEKYMFLNQRNTYMTILSELVIQCLAATSSPQDILDLCQASSPVGFVLYDSCG